MEFQKERVYTALNADELKAGDKVIVANCISDLKNFVADKHISKCTNEITKILSEDFEARFVVDNGRTFPFVYLVERAENCTNCGKLECSAHSNHDDFKVAVCSNWKPKTEKKASAWLVQEPSEKYRPFKDTNELCKAWYAKTQKLVTHYYGKAMEKYCIWVRVKGHTESASLITGFTGDGVYLACQEYSFTSLFYDFEFLDGSPCGVEE